LGRLDWPLLFHWNAAAFSFSKIPLLASEPVTVAAQPKRPVKYEITSALTKPSPPVMT